MRNLIHIPNNELTSLKTKLKCPCEKYSKTNVPYKYKKVIDNLSKRKNIVILKQDKGRGVVILDTTKYTEKCMALLNAEHFKRLTTDPTAATERKIQKVLRKMKSKFAEQEYKRLYPTGSAPARFYGTVKLHKLKNDSTVDDLPIQPIVSNINTASYQLAKYLTKILSPLSTSEYTVKSTSNFITYIKGQNIPNNFKLISFDVTSLFTNVPLDFTIDVILKRIYEKNEVNTNMPKQQMRDLLLLFTKNVHFSYNGDIYTKADGVAMGLPLGPVLAGMFMVELERATLPTLREHMSSWKRYVDDTISYVKEESIE